MTLGKILRKSIIPVATGVLTFFPSKSNAQGPPVDLPSELRGFVEPHELVIDSLFAYNKTNDLLLDGTVLSLADTVTAAGDTVRNVPNFYRFVIPTDKASTPNTVEGATAGDILYFKAKANGNIYSLIPTAGAVIHEPGQIKRVDMNLEKPVAIEDPRNIPKQFSLHQNYPNPFNPITTIKYNLKEKADVLLEVYNIAGQKVRTLVDDVKNIGEYEVIFNGKDISSGVYFVRMKAGEYIETRKMALIK